MTRLWTAAGYALVALAALACGWAWVAWLRSRQVEDERTRMPAPAGWCRRGEPVLSGLASSIQFNIRYIIGYMRNGAEVMEVKRLGAEAGKLTADNVSYVEMTRLLQDV